MNTLYYSNKYFFSNFFYVCSEVFPIILTLHDWSFSTYFIKQVYAAYTYNTVNVISDTSMRKLFGNCARAVEVCSLTL